MDLFEIDRDSLLQELSKDVSPLEDLMGLLGSADPLQCDTDGGHFAEQFALQSAFGGLDTDPLDLQQLHHADQQLSSSLLEPSLGLDTDFFSVLNDLVPFSPKSEPVAENIYPTVDLELLLTSPPAAEQKDDLLDALSPQGLQSPESSTYVGTSSASSSPVSPASSEYSETKAVRTPQLKKLLLDPNFKGWVLPSPEQEVPAPDPAGFVELEMVESSPKSIVEDSEDSSFMYLSACSSPASPGSTVLSDRHHPYQRKQKAGTRPDNRKERKRVQNQLAASRYRQKKRQETEEAMQQSAGLVKENKELTKKVDDLAREIGYMKDLLVEVYKAKGLISDAEKLQASM